MNEDGTTFTLNTPLHEELGAWYLDLLDSKVAPGQSDYIGGTVSGPLFIAGLIRATSASIVGNITNAINQVDGAFESMPCRCRLAPKAARVPATPAIST